MGCLVNLFKIFLGLILIIICLVAGYKLVFDPYRPESPNSPWSYNTDDDSAQQDDSPSIDNISYDVPMQTGPTHDYIMDNTFQNQFVRMELTPGLENTLVYVIKAFKAVFGQDFSPTIISAHDSFDRHDKWSCHRIGCAVDIGMADLPLNEKRRLVKFLKATLPDDEVTIRWENFGIQTEYLHVQYH